MKPILWILCCLPLFAWGAYERNVAKPVDKVIYGEVESIRYITQQEVVRSEHKGWRTLLGATIGGLVGYQFGDGSGQQVATVVGTVAGAAIANQAQNNSDVIQYRLVELLIKLEDGALINVIQDYDPMMRFSADDEVRVLYFSDGVRVDKTL